MPNNPAPPRPLYQPGADFGRLAIPITRQAQRNWYRVHRASSPAVEFGVRSHHRFSHPSSPFPLFYVGASLQTCLWEYFGDDILGGNRVIAGAKWSGCCLSQIAVPSLNVCALSQEPTRDVMGMHKASLMATDLTVPQAWGLAVQEHPAAFEAIKYSSRFVDQPCLALCDRGGMPGRLQVKPLGSLSNLNAAVDWLDQHRAALA